MRTDARAAGCSNGRRTLDLRALWRHCCMLTTSSRSLSFEALVLRSCSRSATPRLRSLGVAEREQLPLLLRDLLLRLPGVARQHLRLDHFGQGLLPVLELANLLDDLPRELRVRVPRRRRRRPRRVWVPPLGAPHVHGHAGFREREALRVLEVVR